MSSVHFQGLSTSFSVKRDDDCSRVFRNADLRVTDKEMGLVASLSAVKIDRNECHGCFLDALGDHSKDLCHFSLELFDDYGRVHAWLIEPGSRSGTGCWNKELNGGQLVFIMSISVAEKYRGQGIGSFTLEKFVTSQYVSKDDVVICWPTPKSNQVPQWKQVKEKQVAFFRKNGFRRVGRTGIFAFSPIKTHPSRSIPIALDANEKGVEFENFDKGLSIGEIRKKYPIHTAIFDGEINVAGIIRNYHQLDPASIHQPNSFGYTPLHLALFTTNLEVVRVLLELCVMEDLNNSNNVECRTPLETLESIMSRQRASLRGGNWKGYNDDELTCEFLMNRAMGKPTMADTLGAYISKRKWGCTCGACAGGWLSNGMRSRLSAVILETLEFHQIEVETFRPRAPHCNPNELFLNSQVPTRIAQVSDAHLRCQDIFEVVREFLDGSKEPLSVAAISALASNNKAVKPFFDKGGRIEHVLDSVTQWALFKELKNEPDFFDHDSAEYMDSIGIKQEYEGPCANDLDFSLVGDVLVLAVYTSFLVPDLGMRMSSRATSE